MPNTTHVARATNKPQSEFGGATRFASKGGLTNLPNVPVAQRIEHQLAELGVGGSNPSRNTLA